MTWVIATASLVTFLDGIITIGERLSAFTVDTFSLESWELFSQRLIVTFVVIPICEIGL